MKALKKTDKSAEKWPSAQPITLKQLAARLHLDAATVSVVLNDVPGRSISQATRDRIKAAATEANYQPSLLARSLRSKRTLTIGILVPEISEGYHTEVVSGIGDLLISSGYFYFTAHHRHKESLIREYSKLLIARGAQGIIAIDTALEETLPVPTVIIAGHRRIEGATNIVLDHSRAAELLLGHLHSLGHRKIAFLKGQPFSSDSEVRWKSLASVAKKMGLLIDPKLVVGLDRDISSPELGYPPVKQLLATQHSFTALVAFNDVSAFGAIRALQDCGLQVPNDVSVTGFDDIKLAAYSFPRLTTINQSLVEIGRLATQTLLNRIHGTSELKRELIVEPQLVVRGSTGPAKL